MELPTPPKRRGWRMDSPNLPGEAVEVRSKVERLAVKIPEQAGGQGRPATLDQR